MMRIDVREALRYLGAARADDATRRQAEEIARELEAQVTPRFVFREFAVEIDAQGVRLPGAGLLLPGQMACTMLRSCPRAALLVCTLGAGFERLLRAAQARDMGRAVVLNACGSAYVEAGCDEAERQIAALHPDLYLSDRFSPGYGDLPLTVQAPLLRAVDAGRRLGVTVTDSHLLIPAKTVTAVIGLSPEPQQARIRGCGHCALRENCDLRKGGNPCVSQ